jgi:hypothetical protein
LFVAEKRCLKEGVLTSSVIETFRVGENYLALPVLSKKQVKRTVGRKRIPVYLYTAKINP